MDEGGFNEPYPEIKAKLKPHEDSIGAHSESSSSSSNQICHTTEKVATIESENVNKFVVESVEKKPVEPIYAVPHKLTSTVHQKSTTSTDSSASQVTVIPQKSVDSDIMYNTTNVITNSVLAELESQESFEKNEEFLQKERDFNETVSAVSEKSEPFLMIRESLKSSDRNTISAEARKAEANILDLNDVEYADASDNEQEIGSCKKVVEADAMTPMEAENLLSSK